MFKNARNGLQQVCTNRRKRCDTGNACIVFLENTLGGVMIQSAGVDIVSELILQTELQVRTPFNPPPETNRGMGIAFQTKSDPDAHLSAPVFTSQPFSVGALELCAQPVGGDVHKHKH